jgi:hypothetical protein
MSAMLEGAEIALAKAQLNVIEARGRFSDQLAAIDRLKTRGEDALEAKQTLDYSKRTFIMERHRYYGATQRFPSA